MKQFLTKISLFIALLATGAFTVDSLLTKGLRKNEVGEFQTWNHIFESKINSDVIVSGSSRAWVHISPQILDSVLNVNSYNLGIDGYPFNMQDVRFKIYEKYNKKPQLIIQTADFITLQRRIDSYNKSQFFPYLHEPLLRNELKKMKGFSNFDFYIPALCYHSNLSSIYAGIAVFFNIKDYSKDRYKGYCGQEKNWNASKLKEILSGDSLVSEINPEVVQLFDLFLNHCKENEIQVIMVFSPEYIEATNFTKNKDEVMNIYRSFSRKYNFPFLDYSRDSLCYDTTYFYNATHLNKKGAELFSLKLANDIKTLGIISEK
jgi:hypothetical protein